MTTHICDIVEVLRQSEGNEELSPGTRARLVMQGIRKLVGSYNDQPHEAKMLGYLLNQADTYLANPETSEIISSGMQNLLYKDAA
jgi:hypothetical protein